MSIARAFERTKAEALARWQAWAQQIADGGKVPDMQEVIAAGSALGIDHAAAELERDAAAILEVRHLEQEAEIVGRAIKDRLTQDGGVEGIRAKLTAARREVDRLEKLVGTNPMHFKLANITNQVCTLRRARTRVFPPEVKQTKRTTGNQRKASRKAVTA